MRSFLGVPIVLRGVAYGMGVNMALACDIVFASDTARLAAFVASRP